MLTLGVSTAFVERKRYDAQFLHKRNPLSGENL
jgi:hypothetical protein